ncbi:MAG: alpha/beta fold hydrolase BchO [Pseudomonadota bacterium]
MSADHPPRARAGEPDWMTDGRDWPLRDVSRFVKSGVHTWHVQRFGVGPILLLLHGTGASTHSWADAAQLLSSDFDVIVMDLPGHAFTRSRSSFTPTLPAMAQTILELLDTLDAAPDFVAGHSAGSAIAVQLASSLGLRGIASVNGALKPFPGLMSFVAPVAAKALTVGGLAAFAASRSARRPGRVERLLSGTGSLPPDQSVEAYRTLFSRQTHVAGALDMMANWDLTHIPKRLRALDTPLLLLAGDHDRAVPPNHADQVAGICKHACAQSLPGLGHLAHEEDPELVARLLRDTFLRQSQP